MDKFQFVEHFKRSEIVCKCGCDLENIDYTTLRKLDDAREMAGIPFIINSACRCDKHNKAVGGAVNSAHLCSEKKQSHAVDIKVINSSDRFIILNSLIKAGFTRFIFYDTFIHADDKHDQKKIILMAKK